MNWIRENIDPKIVEYLFLIKIDNIPNYGGYQRDTAEDLSIDFELLEQQLQDTPQMIAFWNALFAEQKIKVEVIERQIKILRGKIVKKILDDSRISGVEMRSTELREVINADEELIKLDATLLKARRSEERLKNVVESLIRKFDALRSLSGFKKSEQRTA